MVTNPLIFSLTLYRQKHSGPVAWACKSSSLTATLLDVHALDKLQSWLELVVGDRLGPPEVSGYQLGEKCGDQRDAEEPDGGECPAPDDR